MATVLSESRRASGCSGCTQSGNRVGFSAFGGSNSVIRVSRVKPIFLSGRERKVVRFPCLKFGRHRQGRVLLFRAAFR